MNSITHQVPYLPKGRTLYEVPVTDPMMALAISEVAAMERENPGANRAAASVIVKDGAVIGVGRNHSVHPTFCPRKALSVPTGQGYELCPNYCHSGGHSEPTAIKAALAAGHNPSGADLYLAGHWWACEPCWNAMIAAGIRNVFIAQGAKAAYDDAARKDSPLAGKLKRKVKICILGADALAAAEALARVNFVIVDPVSECEAAILLFGAADVPPGPSSRVIYDYRTVVDYRTAISRLSQDIRL